jgi:bifunctional non-homologous end joining protein LigD
MPLSWNELKVAERPVFRVSEFAKWRDRLKKDPWKKKMSAVKQRVAAEV